MREARIASHRSAHTERGRTQEAAPTRRPSQQRRGAGRWLGDRRAPLSHLRIPACTSCACAGVATFPVPMAHTGSARGALRRGGSERGKRRGEEAARLGPTQWFSFSSDEGARPRAPYAITMFDQSDSVTSADTAASWWGGGIDTGQSGAPSGETVAENVVSGESIERVHGRTPLFGSLKTSCQNSLGSKKKKLTCS